MNLETLAIIERALITAHDVNVTSEEAEQASEALGALRRRDWDVRVLDAWRRAKPGRRWFTGFAGECVTHDVHENPRDAGANREHGLGLDEGAARHAAALAVWDSLSAETKARIGECP